MRDDGVGEANATEAEAEAVAAVVASCGERVETTCPRGFATSGFVERGMPLLPLETYAKGSR